MIDDLHTTIRSGTLAAVRAPGLAMLIGDGVPDAVDRLVDMVHSISGADGRRLVRRLAVGLADDDDEATPPFALVADDGPDVVVFVHGAMRITADGGDGAEVVRVADGSVVTWADRVLRAPLCSVRLEPDDATTDERPAPHFTLGRGTVPAGAMFLTRQAAPPVPAAPARAPLPPPMPNVEPINGDHNVEVRPRLRITTGSAPAVAAPGADVELVEGVLCSRGHLSSPASPYCSSCGIAMVHRTHNVVVGPRPPLGFLVFDDGTTHTLDRGYVVGREPDDDSLVVAGMSRPLSIDDPDRSVSRVHAEIVLDGWNVQVVDRGSTNGTFVFDEAEERWEQLAPGTPCTVPPSTRLGFGSRTCVFETPHQAPGRAVRARPPVRR